MGGRGIGSFKVRTVRGYTTKLHEGRQGKHIEYHNNYQEGKSKLTVNQNRAQELVNEQAGKGQRISDTKERVNFGETIGQYYDSKTGAYQDTDWGIIHYSKDGTHIIPASPDGYK